MLRGKKLAALTIGVLLVLSLGLLGCEPEAEETEIDEPEEANGEVEEVAEEYPIRTIDLIVPSGTGGSTDVTARTISAHAHYLGEATVVTNMPGAAFTIGTDHVVNSEPDGYTLLVATESPLSFAPLAMPDEVDYTSEDLEPVAGIALNQFSIAINANTANELGIDDLNDMLAYAEENPGELTVGYSSILFDVWREVFLDLGYDLTVVLQDSGGAAASSAAGGHIDIYFGAWPGIQGPYEEGYVEMLTTLPYQFEDDIPSIEEYPEVNDALGLSMYSVNSVFAPAGTPQHVIDNLDAAFAEMFEDEGFTDMLEAQGLVPHYEPHEEFKERIIQLCEDTKQFEDTLATFGQ